MSKKHSRSEQIAEVLELLDKIEEVEKQDKDNIIPIIPFPRKTDQIPEPERWSDPGIMNKRL